ncbi:hypothetical protein evm_006733 [Chilo suppressalis]|nr:hypothetical protein evm_006733 [Chilo suppressalis]
MDAKKSLKECHPQKYYLTFLFRVIYYLGMGDCWYEKTERSRTHKILYGIWAFIYNSYLILNTINQVTANFRSDLTVKEKNDMIQFTFAHPCFCVKYMILIFQKERVRNLFKRMMEGNRSIYSSIDLDKESVRKAIIYSICLAVITLWTLLFALMDGIFTYISEGIPIRTEVVLYPTRHNSGFFVNILRFLVELHWWCIITNMLVADCLCVSTLIFSGYKFKIVTMYFNNLRKKTRNKIGTKSRLALRDDFEKDFKLGIQLHEEALWCAGYVQYAIGNLYSVQVFETITLLVMCLVKLVTNERNLTFLIAVLTYICCLVAMTLAYFSAAGDVTYHASTVSTSMFHCGWEFVAGSKSLRTMAVVAIQRSQVPVYMTAFGVMLLSYSNFISGWYSPGSSAEEKSGPREDGDGHEAVVVLVDSEVPKRSRKSSPGDGVTVTGWIAGRCHTMVYGGRHTMDPVIWSH